MFDLKMRVLVIDDMGTMRKIVSKVFRELGYTDLIEAADGALGWQALTESNPPVGIIVSDWNMPNCTGLELLKRVRGDKRYAHLPFLLVTAEAEQHQIVQAITAGVNGYIVKPFTPVTLKEKLVAVYNSVTGKAKAS